MTLIAERVSDTPYKNALALLGEKYVAEAILAIIAINAWNRIGVATNMEPAVEGEVAPVIK